MVSPNLILAALFGWLEREQRDVIEFLRQENRVLKAQLHGRRMRLSDDERRRLAVIGQRLGRRLLAQVATIVTPDTILRWHRELVARKWTVNLVNGAGNEIGQWLLDEQGIRFYTFTGSTSVGRAIQRGAGLRRTQLELGSISSTIVCDDASVEWAVPRCVNASFRKAGQVCTSVQRLFVHQRILDRFVEQLVARTEASKVGDPRDPATLVGPMIHIREAERAEAWVREAVSQGAQIASGGRREGALFYPTILVNVTREMRVMCEELFAPIISVVPFHSLDEAIGQVNDTPYGLAAGLFTSNISTALHAARRLEVGSVHVNETSSSRVDLMPYGGVKDSGFGREGPKYAIREMTEERLVTITCV